MDTELLPPQMLGFVSSAKHRAAALGAVMVVVMSLRDGSLRGAAPVLGLPPLKQPRAHLGLWDVWLCPDVTKKKKNTALGRKERAPGSIQKRNPKGATHVPPVPHKELH